MFGNKQNYVIFNFTNKVQRKNDNGATFLLINSTLNIAGLLEKISRSETLATAERYLSLLYLDLYD